MTVPVLGPMSLSGFTHQWYFLYLLAVLGIVSLYLVVLFARQRRVMRFANMDLLASVAPTGSKRWRQLPADLLVTAMLMLTIAIAGPANDVRNRETARSSCW